MIAAIVLFIILSSIVAISYILNKNTQVPKGCENLKTDCGGCNIISCIHHPTKGEVKE